MISRLLILAVATLAGCSELPKDPEGTLDRVRTERRFSVGLIDWSPHSEWALVTSLFLDRIESRSGARAHVVFGASEPLLTKLEQGELDLVIGSFAPTSPWEKRVSVLPGLAEHVAPEEHIRLAPVARNGENAWIDLLHLEAVAVRAGR